MHRFKKKIKRADINRLKTDPSECSHIKDAYEFRHGLLCVHEAEKLDARVCIALTCEDCPGLDSAICDRLRAAR